MGRLAAKLFILSGLMTLAVGVAASPSAAAIIGPSPSPTTAYLSFADSPFNGISFSYFHLETFEGNALSTPGVAASAGGVLGPGGNTDSVDADDGAINGSGTGGHSWFFIPGSAGVRFTFDATVLGRLPTHAGIVWTDGSNDIHFEAFDQNGVSLGTATGSHADGSFGGTTGEDRFYGATNPGGISSIFIKNDSGGIEVDHLQYGAQAIDSRVPEPGTLLLLGVGAIALAVRRRA